MIDLIAFDGDVLTVIFLLFVTVMLNFLVEICVASYCER